MFLFEYLSISYTFNHFIAKKYMAGVGNMAFFHILIMIKTQ